MPKLPSLRRPRPAAETAEPPVTIRRRRSAPLLGPAGVAAPAASAAAPRTARPAAPIGIAPAALRSVRSASTITAVGRSAVAPVTGVDAQPAAQTGSLPLWNTRTQVLAAFVCWCSLAGIIYALSPDDSAARVGFFTALFGALFFTLVPVIRTVWLQFSRSRLYQQAVGRHSTRQALEIALLITLNAALQMQRAWNPLTALLLLSVFVIVELVALSRR